MNLLQEHKLRKIIRQIIINEATDGLPYFMQVLQTILVPKVSEGGSLHSIWTSMMGEPEKLKSFEAQLLALFKHFFDTPIARDEPLDDPTPYDKEGLKESYNLMSLMEFLEEKLEVKLDDNQDSEDIDPQFLFPNLELTPEEEEQELTPEEEAEQRKVEAFGVAFKDLTPDQKTGVRAAGDVFESMSKEIENKAYSELFGEDRVNFNKYFLANLEAYFQKYADENELNKRPEIEDPSGAAKEPEEGLEQPVEEPKEPEATESTEEEPEAL
jgi:hypothetical protein